MVELGPGDERTLEMRLLEGLAVAGRAADEQGKPIPDARAEIHQEVVARPDWPGGAGLSTAWAETDADGRWRAKGAARGVGTLVVSADGYSGR